MIVERLKSHLSSGKYWLVLHHVSPDSDAIGSSFALAACLRAAGEKASVVMRDAVPSRLERIVASKDLTDLIIAEHELYSLLENGNVIVVVTDTATENRINSTAQVWQAIRSAQTEIFNIDHHVSNTLWADVNHVVTEAASCCQIIVDIIGQLGLPKSPAIANLLYAGMLDDTGRFCFSSVNGDVLRAASIVLDNGADPEFVAGELYWSVPEKVLLLRKIAFDHLEFSSDSGLALTWLADEDFTLANAQPEDSEGVVDEIRSLKGVKVAVFIRQIEDGWKASLRTKAGICDVNRIASLFGGGGHKAAAGCRLVGSLDVVKSDISSAILTALHDLSLS
ncbi:MAG: DHH family phosphoesterase [bacterium]|nr:DHH family phosphoesterase [bacterium]